MDLILTLVGGLMGGGVLSFVTFLISRKDNKDDFKEKVIERLDKVEQLGIEMNRKFDEQSELNMVEGKIMLDTLNHKFREQGYIGDDEYPLYLMLGERYERAGGNGTVGAMFHRNLDHLEVHK